MLGAPFADRGAALNEYIPAMKMLWESDGRAVEFHGDYVDFEDVIFDPRPVQKPMPMWFGGREHPALRRLAHQGEGWISSMVSRERLPETMDYIHAHQDIPRPIALYMPLFEGTWHPEEHWVIEPAKIRFEKDAILEQVQKLADLGVTLTDAQELLGFGRWYRDTPDSPAPIKNLDELLERAHWFAEEIMPDAKKITAVSQIWSEQQLACPRRGELAPEGRSSPPRLRTGFSPRARPRRASRAPRTRGRPVLQQMPARTREREIASRRSSRNEGCVLALEHGRAAQHQQPLRRAAVLECPGPGRGCAHDAEPHAAAGCIARPEISAFRGLVRCLLAGIGIARAGGVDRTAVGVELLRPGGQGGVASEDRLPALGRDGDLDDVVVFGEVEFAYREEARLADHVARAQRVVGRRPCSRPVRSRQARS